MVKQCLFEDCNKKPELLIHHFQDIFVGLACIELETTFYTSIGSNEYHKIHIIEEISDILQSIRSRWYCIQEVLLNDNNMAVTNILDYRSYINEAFKTIIRSILLCDNSIRKDKYIEDIINSIKIFLNSVIPLSKVNQIVVNKIALTSNNNPYYQYLHTLLEVYYYIMVLFYLCGITLENTEKYLEEVMRSMIFIGKASFKKYNNFTTVMSVCECVKSFWLVIQLITEKMDVTGSLFWRIFNKVLENEDPILSFTILRDISLLQSYNIHFEDIGSKSGRIKSNYDFLENKMKQLLVDADCDTLIYGLKIAEPLLCNLWLKEGKIGLYQVLWDFYSKRLNLSNKNSSSISAIQLIDTLDAILYSPKNCKDDFEIFIGFLLYHLNEYPMQWPKIKGRIYSQLGPNKVKDLSEVGIRHVMLLFMALSTISFEELEKKMLSFIESLPPERKFSSVVWNIYSAIILKYVRDGRSIEPVASQMVRMLQEASLNHKAFHLIKEFVTNLESIVLNSLNMNLHQHLLFGSWLGKYQSICYFPDLTKSLEVTLLLLDKCGDADCWSIWESCFKEVIYVNLKQLVSVHNPPAIIGKIAGKIALLYTNLTTDAFNYFSNDIVPPNITSSFLEIILENYPDQFILTPQQENLIVQSWVKICFLSLNNQHELTKHVLKLDIFSPDMKNCIRDSDDSMEAFINCLGIQSQQSYDRTMDLVKICDISFNNLDKPLGQYIIKPDNEGVVLKIYHYSSLMFLNCSKLVYNKNKSVTVLTKIVEVLLLPMDFMVGKRTPHSYVLTAIRNCWEVFFKAFMNLSSATDPYIDRILKDMVVKYMPYYSTTDSPIVSSLKTFDCASIIFEKIYIAYFKPGSKETDANVLKALKILAELINTTNSLPLLRLLIKKTLRGLFEVVIFHSQRSTAIGVIRNLTLSPFFKEIREEFKEAVLAVSDKNVGLNTINYFQLVISLAKFAPNEIKDVLEDIKMQVVNVERLRGVGFDKTLRAHLEKLENALQISF